MIRIKFQIKSVAVVLMLLFSTVVAAQYGSKNEISLEEASEYVRNTSNGKILSARTSTVHGKRTHRIQVLTPSGRVKVYNIDANKKSGNNNSGSRYNTPRNSNSGYGDYRYRNSNASGDYGYNTASNSRNYNSTTQRRSRQK